MDVGRPDRVLQVLGTQGSIIDTGVIMNIIWMKSKSDWFVMNMVKQYLKDLKKLPANEENIEAINRNEMVLRSFMKDIKERSSDLHERSIPLAA